MATAARIRADLLLVERGLFESRAKAQEAIAAGRVAMAGVPVRKPSDLVRADAEIAARAAHPYVSRGGVKLAHALDTFRIEPAGRACLDVGASTGGFTDVLLRLGASHVYAVDVGTGQLHPSLKADARVTSLESTDIRSLDPAICRGPIGLATVDVSFISLRLILSKLKLFLSNQGHVVALIKPQFEAGRGNVGRGGVVRDPQVRDRVVLEVAVFAREQGFEIVGTTPSPIAGGDGNQEHLIGLRHG